MQQALNAVLQLCNFSRPTWLADSWR